MSLRARTLTPLGVFGLYVAGHVYCREFQWNPTRGYVPKHESTISPDFKFAEVGDLSASLRQHLNQ